MGRKQTSKTMGSRLKRAANRSERIEIEFIESIRKRCAPNRMILETLGELYTRTGRYEEGLNADLELTRICPSEAIAWYNLGCSYALIGRKKDALAALTKAIELGYKDIEWMNIDSDLESIQDDPQFRALLKRARG
jgi:tetratricopeptide (TPR) repeat protein